MGWRELKKSVQVGWVKPSKWKMVQIEGPLVGFQIIETPLLLRSLSCFLIYNTERSVEKEIKMIVRLSFLENCVNKISHTSTNE